MRWPLIFLIVLVACTAPAGRPDGAQYIPPITQTAEAPMKLTTSDGYSIAYTYYPSFQKTRGAPGAILLHQLGRNRTDFKTIAPKLVDVGYAAIAIDVRGHGESSGNWQQFTSNDFNAAAKDILAAKEFLKSQGVDTTNLLLVGTSFSANLAINYAATDTDVTRLFAISPGVEFRGIKISNALLYLPAKNLFVAATDDDYSEESVKEMAKASALVKTKIYPSGGHGFFLFGTTKLADDLVTFAQS